MNNAIPVIAAGNGWIIVDKPFGMSSHNEPGHDLISSVARILENDHDLSTSTGYLKNKTLSPVHRLDRDTSGLILLAFEKDVQRWFSKQFEDRTVKKNYVALVHGDIGIPDNAEGIWDTPLSPEAGGRKNPAGAGKKVPCRTRYRVIRKSPHYTLIECEPLTGRKHQIRRHAKLAGHPVLGDTRYGSERAVNYLKNHCNFDRLALHSLSLAMTLPGEQKQTVFQSVYPDEFTKLMDEDQVTYECQQHI